MATHSPSQTAAAVTTPAVVKTPPATTTASVTTTTSVAPPATTTAVATTGSVATSPPAPTPQALANTLGVQLTAPLTAAQVKALVKALPGYVGVLSAVATQLVEDSARLGPTTVTPALLADAAARQRFYANRQGVLKIVAKATLDGRLHADNDGMTMILAIKNLVVTHGASDPGLLENWKFLIDFLATFRPGPPTTKAKAKAAAKATAAAEAVKAVATQPPATASVPTPAPGTGGTAT